jgi:Fe-S oxidoreductase
LRLFLARVKLEVGCRITSAVSSRKVTIPTRCLFQSSGNNPALGLAAVDALEALDCQVVLPPQEVSGYPYIAYGDMDSARKTAANVEKLAPYVKEGFDVVAIEPTAAYALAVSYPT